MRERENERYSPSPEFRVVMDVQPMTINGHLLLLVLATGAFVRVWNANSHLQISSVARTTRQMAVASAAEPAPLASATAPVPQSKGVHQTVSASVTTAAPAEENWTAANCPIPLPTGISAGTYRVVDDTGRVARLEIAGTDDATVDTNRQAIPNRREVLRREVPSRREVLRREVAVDFNIVSIGTHRWYFIRLQAPVAIDMREKSENEIGAAEIDIESDACPFRNRKFDFRGYETSSQPDESDIGASVVGELLGEEITRPDSPDLPISR
jgi:hypothetical protein